MRCVCCNVVLSGQEATRKFKESGEYTDMCTKCLSTIDDQVSYTEGNNIKEEHDHEDEYDEWN